MTSHSQRGATLIELVVAIVIISAAASTIVGLLAFMSRTSADALLQSQSTSIANAYLNEILSRPITDPNAPTDAGRDNADDIDDYLNLAGNIVLPDALVRDRSGTLVAGLQNYRVQAVITQPPVWNAPGINILPAQMRLVTITVTDPMGEITVLRGLKTQHP